MRSINRRWRMSTGLVILILTLMGAPAAANAAFNDTDVAATKVSAAVLPAPSFASMPVTASCEKSGKWTEVNISVASNYGTVSYANYLELKVVNPDGQMEFTGDLSQSSGRAYSSKDKHNDARGNWTYEIRGYYKVPGSTNSWASTPLTGTLACP